MTRQDIIDVRRSLREPNRRIDQTIAAFFNYRRKEVSRSLKGMKTPRIRISWYDPKGKEIKELPRFTRDIDAAKSLFDFVLHSTAGGFSFHNGYAKAALEGGAPVTAFNIATALC